MRKRSEVRVRVRRGKWREPGSSKLDPDKGGVDGGLGAHKNGRRGGGGREPNPARS